MRYNNYHKHTHESNVRTSDCIVFPEHYMQRAKELNHNTYFTTEHGCSGNVWGVYDLCKKYGLKCIYGAEAYYVDNRFVKEENKNYHIVLIAKNNDGMKDINRIISKANVDGFYYKPRIDLDLMLSLNPKNIYVTTACVLGRINKGDNPEELFLIPLLNHFGNHLFLEVQSHNHLVQIQHNKRMLELSKKYNIKIIHGNDSHYIFPEDSVWRDKFLKGKDMIYDDEKGFILDYPSSEDIISRYLEQNVLSLNEITESLNNTLIFDECEDLGLTKEIKMPSIFNDIDKNKKDEIFDSLLMEHFQHINKKTDDNYTKKYLDAIDFESNIVKETDMTDYFLLNERIIDRAVNKYNGIITPTGRGCFTEDSLVHTKETIKSIKDIVVGDEIVTKSGLFKKVTNTMSYDIEEELIKITHLYGTDKHYPTICTLDHKILINRNNDLRFIEAKDIKENDCVCVPKIKVRDNKVECYDLVDYNIFGYDYDDKYIYENIKTTGAYPYSPSELSKKLGVGNSVIEKFAKGERVFFNKKTNKLKELMNLIPFSTQQEYVDYIKDIHTRKIPRYIKNDRLFNILIGLMYGDGCISKIRGSISLAINNSNFKNVFNRRVFHLFSKRINLSVKEVKRINKKLSELYIHSNIICEFMSQLLFESQKHKDKPFNKILFNQNRANLEGILIGLQKSDGHLEEQRINFDNTSKSLINAYKLLCLMTEKGVNLLQVRPYHKDNRGCICKESFKLRNYHNKFIEQNDMYYFLPIKTVEFLPKQKTTVYDITVEDEHNYLINNMIVHNSSVSFYINKLLGFTNIDRIVSPVTLYPTRFMSKTRILQTKSLPDIDFNLSSPEPFIKASKDILGEDNVYYMVAYGTMQESGAFRNLCRAIKYDLEQEIKELCKLREQNEYKVDIDEIENKISSKTKFLQEFSKEYNEVGKNLDAYKNDEKWKGIIEDSKHFIGVIDSISPSPCSFLLLNEPISEEIGLIRVGDEICCCIDGYNADIWKFLKNDFLTVKVLNIISQTFKLINSPIIPVDELIKKLDKRVWDMYALGLTATLNQVDSDFAKPLVMKYKPKSVAEMTAFVASIRPAFASLRDNFLERMEYSTGIKQIDDLLCDSYCYILYQESIMKILTWCGIAEDETYGIIKKIAKKKFKEQELQELKTVLKNGFIAQTGSDEKFDDIWQVIEDSASYAFNASHALSVAIDSLYGAYLKSHYPLQYYSVVFNLYDDDTKETEKIVSELDYFNIKLKPIQFKFSRSSYFFDEKTNYIYKGLKSIKYLNEIVAEELYALKNNSYNNFVELLVNITENTSCNSKQLRILTALNYFKEFGGNQYLLNIVKMFEKRYKKTHIAKTKANRLTEIIEYSLTLDRTETLNQKEQIQAEFMFLGHTNITIPNLDIEYALVVDISKKYTHPMVSLYHLKNGEMEVIKCKNKYYSKQKFKQYDLIKVVKRTNENKWMKTPAGFSMLDETEPVLQLWNIVK